MNSWSMNRSMLPLLGMVALLIAALVLFQSRTLQKGILPSRLGTPVPGASHPLIATTCAPWLKRSSQRKVAFVDLATMKAFYRRRGIYHGGEFYMAACLDYALCQNGFTVDRIGVRSILASSESLQEITQRYHLVVANGFEPWARLNASGESLKWSKGRCKLRMFGWWGDHLTPDSGSGLHPKQSLKPFPPADFYNTFLGFFPHSVLQRQVPMARRGKVGMLLGKVPESFHTIGPVVEALLLDGFELHTTCADCSQLAPSVIRHDHIGPAEYATLLQSCAFLLGGGHPYDSPSPLEGLANGVAFLNPIAVERNGIFTE